MKIDIRDSKGTAILSPKGKITIGVGDVALREAVRKTLDAGAGNILINFENVPAMDSSGLGELVSSYTTVTNRGGKLKLCCLPNKIIQILQVTQLISIFEIYHSEDEAVASFD